MDSEKHLEALSDIRNMMERSTRFVSLSGLSGVFAGIFALAGAWAAYMYLGMHSEGDLYYEYSRTAGGERNLNFYEFFFTDAVSVLVLSVAVSTILTVRKARKAGEKVWNPVARRLFWNMLIPLLSGGAFCLIMVYHNTAELAAPAMLIFYGLALVNASKYTFNDVRFLGIIEIILGLAAAVYLRHGLLFWSLGFGVMHIVYGIVMYAKYEVKK